MADESYVMRQRRAINDTILAVLKDDPDYDKYSAIVKGWVLVMDLSGLTPESDRSAVRETRGEPWADVGLWSSDATGESDLPPHLGEGLLRYVAEHYGAIYDDQQPVPEEDDEDEHSE